TVTKDGRALGGKGRVEVLPDSRPDSRVAGGREYPMVGGVATIPGAQTGDVLRVRIRPEGEPPVAGTVALKEGEAELELRGTAFIAGRARFADGAPVADEDLVARLFRAGQPDETREIRTEADGAFKTEVDSGRDVLLELFPRGSVKGEDVASLVFQRESLEAGSTWDLGPDAVTF